MRKLPERQRIKEFVWKFGKSIVVLTTNKHSN